MAQLGGTSKGSATIEDLYHVPENGKAEIVDGELVLMSPTGFLPSRAGLAISMSLKQYERRTRRGFVLPDNAGFIVDLPRRKSFSPDAAFYSGEPTRGKFVRGAPLFAAEVRSEDEYGPAAERKRASKRGRASTPWLDDAGRRALRVAPALALLPSHLEITGS